MKTTIRVGIIGAGANTRLRHLPELQSIDGVEVTAVVNRSRESSQRVADDFVIPTVADNWREITSSPDIDAIVIGTWPYLHCPITVAALRSGKHVLCEARMAMNAKEAREMYRVSLEHPHLVTQIVPSPFTLSVDATVRRLLSDGYLGELYAIELRGTSNGFIKTDGVRSWREIREFSGNNTMSLGIWYEAVMRWIGTATRVTAMGRTFKPLLGNGADYSVSDIPNHLDVIAEMACGAQMHMQLSQATGTGGSTEALLFGSEGSLKFVDGKLYGAGRGEERFSEIAIPEDQKGFWRVEKEFIEAIRGGPPVTLTDFMTGVRYMEFTDAVTLSMRTGASVPVPTLS